MRTLRPALPLTALLAASALALTACAGEDAPSAAGSSAGTAAASQTLSIDFATYNPLSLVIKDQGWLEEELSDDGVTVEWVQSAGSNKANEALRSGAIDVGSTAGSAALLNRANGAPIKTIVVANQPEWSALLTGPDSDITSIEQLEGRSVAATKGTDPYFFLIQALEGAGVEPSSVTVQNLQHADGRAALENGSVDAWAGLDPIMAAAEANGARFVHRDPDLNSYSVVNATEDFLTESPETAQVVADTYERARRWAVENPEETARILAEVAGLEESVATQVIAERTNLDISPVPGKDQRRVLSAIGPIFVDTGDVPDQEQVDEALETLFDPTFAEKAESK
ncbi:aliphatic sulfonate ABC transporter substrate-binding protein [Micrococcus flavus]|uniref:Putative aliphatic sulfonates-binding protein n=2 Tax=Micrococcus flavus TaxID=384602 RepID=A0A4Y8X1B9_9MICC|nr:aliphatic sulfonate ABC transporter substrate-binding protein [Micrococcus flavus]MBB4883598.1 sulfonate transport system substrate-binding protein [Micrococcus flavus]TFI02462.1 aliphatic sulfonate ABC transporter substrate-binding protein [Micrococcus flavus]GGK53159.1 ABC transporter substrate-binding protein [Micrococcus flavus]